MNLVSSLSSESYNYIFLYSRRNVKLVGQTFDSEKKSYSYLKVSIDVNR